MEDTYMGELYPGVGTDKRLARMIEYTDEDIAKNLPKFTGYIGDAFILVHDLQDKYGIYFQLHTGKGGAVATFYRNGSTIGQGQAHSAPVAICRAFIRAWAVATLPPINASANIRSIDEMQRSYDEILKDNLKQ